MSAVGSDAWLAGQAGILLDTAAASRDPAGGFGWLGDDGTLRRGVPTETYITSRMTHCFALAALEGRLGAAELVDHGVAALSGLLRDAEHGGWYSAVAADGTPVDEGAKAAYPHMFVVLAAASATVARRPGARALLDDALEVVRTRFWDEEAGACVESWNRDWTRLEDYRGANANMHAVEAFLAAADATDDDWWRAAALRIATRLIDGAAREHGWRLPEHYDADWAPQLDYAVDTPSDAFRPYGATIGHGLEWARLLLHLEAGDPAAPAWLRAAAQDLFAASVRDGWAVDGEDGFVYTVDWEGTPVVRARMHWVVVEGIAAAAALHTATGDQTYADQVAAWWSFSAEHLIDADGPGWRHELDEHLRPASTVWVGRPDAYHSLQALLIPRLPLAPTITRAVRERAATGAEPLIGG